MSDAARTAVPRVATGPWIPAVAPRVLLVVVGVLLGGIVLSGPATGLPLALGVLAAVRPRTPAAWLLVALLAAGEALRDPGTVGLELLPLVAGVHLVAVLALLSGALPARGRIALAALARPALLFVAIQLPAQALGLLVLALGRGGALPPAALAGAAALVALAVLLGRRLAPRRG